MLHFGCSIDKYIMQVFSSRFESELPRGSHVGLLFVIEEQKRLVRGVFDTFANYNGLVYDVS